MRSAPSSAQETRSCSRRARTTVHQGESLEIIPFSRSPARPFPWPQSAKSKPLDRPGAGGLAERASSLVKIDSGGMPADEAEAPSTAQMTERLERVLAGSPAAATELVWIETRRGRETTGKQRREAPERRDSMVLLRVREAGRTGVHRTAAGDLSELENGLRDAPAHARIAASSADYPLAPGAASPLAAGAALHAGTGSLLAPGAASPLAAGAGPAPRPELFEAEVARRDHGRRVE